MGGRGGVTRPATKVTREHGMLRGMMERVGRHNKMVAKAEEEEEIISRYETGFF